MIKQKVMEFILIWMERNIKDNGKKTNNMEMARKLGLMVLYMKEII